MSLRQARSDLSLVTTFASVGAFTFFPLRIPLIVLLSNPVLFVVSRNPFFLISSFKLSFADGPELPWTASAAGRRTGGRRYFCGAKPIWAKITK